MSEEDFPDALPPGHRLHWYVLERVLGQGGFGITYLAHDSNLDRRVAIKEYLPAEVARRRSDASARPRTESHTECFAWGLERFLAEARTLARFDHPNIVRVLSIFEANSTAYMVMRFEEGEDLGTLLDRRSTLPERELMEVLLPVLGGLQLIHSSGFIHRDIKPENIYLRDDGTPVLLDFGSARQSFGSAKTMTILVAPGYAPLEQYYGDAKTQGPWTDIYGLAATCYRAVTGGAPLDAVARAKGVLGSTRDLLEPAATLAQGTYNAQLLAAIDHALQLNERDRPQSISEWRRELVAPSALRPDPAVGPTRAVASPTGSAPSPPVPMRPGLDDRAMPVRTRSDVGADREEGAGLLATAGGRWAVAGAFCVVATATYFGTRSAPTVPAPLAAAPASLVAADPVASSPSAALAAIESAATIVAKSGDTAAVATIDPAPAAREAPGAARGNGSAAHASPPESLPAAGADHAKDGTRVPPHEFVAAATTPTGAAATKRGEMARPSGTAPAPNAGVTAASAGVTPAAPASALAGPTAAPIASMAAAVTSLPPTAASSRRRDEQLDSADAALRRGDLAGAVEIASPWAAAGVARAQALLGRAQEARGKEQHSDFEAYVWYGIAARGGEPTAQVLRDKVAGCLQPAEIHQAEQVIERWKPHAAGAPDTSTSRSTP